MIFRFHHAENIQETDKYHSLEFVHCSDWLFQPNFGRFLIRTKLDFGRYFLLICKSTENLDSQKRSADQKITQFRPIFGQCTCSITTCLLRGVFGNAYVVSLYTVIWCLCTWLHGVFVHIYMMSLDMITWCLWAHMVSLHMFMQYLWACIQNILNKIGND